MAGEGKSVPQGKGEEMSGITFHPDCPAKSLCFCGHTGDGIGSDHRDRWQPGHGGCMVKGCDCKQFTWSCFLPSFQRLLDKLNRKGG